MDSKIVWAYPSYEVILAIINMSGDGGGFTDQTDMLEKAREEVAKMGANAIILSGYAQGDYNALWGTQADNEGSAIAVDM